MPRPCLATAIRSILSAGALLLGGDLAAQRADAPPVIPALAGIELSPAIRGRVLLVELGCTNCHASDGAERRAAPDLATVGARVRADYLRRFLTSPADTEPGTPMPDALRRHQGEALRTRVDALVHYLRSLADAPADTVRPDAAAAERGLQLWNTIGCRNCHDRNAASRRHLADKYTVESLQAFLLAPHRARPARRMPQFALSPAEAFALAAHLLRDAQPAPRATAIDPNRVEAGRTVFAQHGCNDCHRLQDTAAGDVAGEAPPALADVDPERGCLSQATGRWPHYALSPDQQRDLRAALQAPTAPTAEDRITQHLTSRNCFACHTRGDVDATEEQLDLFETNDPSIGMEGMFPPTLTGVGAKLQRAWLGDAIAHGQRERPYLKVRMPGFGATFAEVLADELAAADELPPIAIAPLPNDRKEARKVTDLGAELVGDKAMNCIVCHRFAGESFGQMPAIDLVHSTGQRLRPEWFAHFLRDPFRFKPNTLMTRFFVDGRSTRPEFADGDVDRQIHAIWHYLAEGRNVRKPRGMRRPPIELKVGNEAVLLRRAVQDTGKRGISVGYPGGVNITFDAETLAMNHVWWGRFVDARPVWTSQGHGQAQILERDRVRLPKGPAFAILESSAFKPSGVVSEARQTWPTTTRRERGDRWIGYELDERRRPTFHYTVGKVKVEDKPHEVLERGELILRRTLRVTGPCQLLMRVARGARIERVDEHTTRVDRRLTVHCADAPAILVGDGDSRELRLLITTFHLSTSIDIDYRRTREGR